MRNSERVEKSVISREDTGKETSIRIADQTARAKKEPKDMCLPARSELA
jgi:hypothetical protein